MKRTTIYLFIAAATGLLGACREGSVLPEEGGTSVSPDFTATIGGGETRASDRTWDAGDRIGVTGCGRTNVSYTNTDGGSIFTVSEPGYQIYFPDDSEETFTAYYPLADLDEGDTAIGADTREQGRQRDFDFLWASGSGRRDTPHVDLDFTHRMTKMVITVRPGTEITFDNLRESGMWMVGCRHAGSFNTTDGSTATEDAIERWTLTNIADFDATEETMTFTLILFPQILERALELTSGLAIEGHDTLFLRATVDFTEANREKDGAAARNEWKAGRQYNLSLRFSRTGLWLESAAIAPWENEEVKEETAWSE